jgi:hypothetical protein
MTRRSRAVTLSAESILAAGLSLRLAHRTMPARPAGAITVAVASGRLPHREIRFLPLRKLTVGPGKRRPDQSAMNRAVVFTPFVNAVRIRTVGVRGRSDGNSVSLGANVGGASVRIEIVDGTVERRAALRLRGRNGTRTGLVKNVLRQRASLLPAQRRGLGLLVFVLGVACRTPRLPDIVFDHRDDDVIGDAALARTVIVQNVTEPKPALLHELPRSGPFGWN